MKFESVNICNFGALGDVYLELADRGLILVQGENKDDTSSSSNGSGKSWIADAISWALTGKTARGETGDVVVNRTAGEDCVVQVVIRDGTTVYVVSRYRKHKINKNGLFLSMNDGTTVLDLTQGTEKLTQEKIDQILGCSYDVFTAAIYAGQEHMADLPMMTDKALKVLIEEAAGISIVERAYDVAKKRALVAEQAVQDAQRHCDGAKHAIELAQTKLDALAAAQDHWNKNRDAQIEANVNAAKKDIGDIRVVTVTVASINPVALAEDLSAETARLNSVEGEKKEERRLEEERRRITDASAKTVSAATASTSSLKATALSLKRHVEELQHDLTHAESTIGTACETCSKPITEEDVSNVRDNLKRALNLAVQSFKNGMDNYNAANKRLSDAQSEARTAQENALHALEAYRATMTDVSATSARIASLHAQKARLTEAETKIKTLKERAAELLNKANEMKVAMNPYDGQVMTAGSTLMIEKKLHDDLRVTQSKMTEERAMIADAVKVFGPAGVRAEILDTVTPYLNSRTAHYLGMLSDGNISATWSTLIRNKAGELKEKFCIEVENKVGGEKFGLISGGEKRKVRLGCALAMQDLVATRATKPIDLFIGDEIDHALDTPGLERLTTVLEEKARERGTVLVISHNDLKDWCRQSITVVKEGGKATLMESI